MKKYKLSGLSEVIGSFSVIGTEHFYDKGSATLSVETTDGGRTVITNIISYESVLISETDAEKVVRLEKALESLQKEYSDEKKDWEKLRSKKNDAFKEIISLSNDGDIPLFGKRKVFAEIYSLAEDGRCNYLD